MVFFTSVLIVVIFYYLQTDGLIYVTIIAVVAELINIFMTHTLTRSVEKKAADGFSKISTRYKAKIAEQQETIKELENIREDSVRKLYKANMKIKDYEEKLGIQEPETISPPAKPKDTAEETSTKETEPSQTPRPRKDFIDLPEGSNRKKRLI